ncbi:hypothetical protein M8C21_014450, partial [Ambrosia artemisiifolia]
MFLKPSNTLPSPIQTLNFHQQTLKTLTLIRSIMDDEETRRQGFRVRKNLLHEEVLELYVGAPSLFSIKLHHNGRFTRIPERTYVEGKENYIDLLNQDKFSVHEMDRTLEKFGYQKDIERYYHYKVPGSDLDFGLRALGSDDDVIWFLKLFQSVGWNGDKPEAMHTEEVVDIVNFHHAFDFSNMNLDYPDFDPFFGVQPTVNVHANVHMADQPQDNMHKHDNASEDKHDNASEDEAMHRSEYESEDNDFLVDEGNMINEVETNMRDFRFFTNDVQDDDQVTDVGIKEMQEEAIDNDQFISGSESDEGETSLRKRTLKLLRSQNNKNDTFHVGQKFGTKDEVKQIIKKHAVDTRKQLRIIKDDLR